MENRNEMVTVPNVYFDKDAGYFKFKEPSAEELETMKKLVGINEEIVYDASDYFFEIFSQMDEANFQNANNGYLDEGEELIFDEYFSRLFMFVDEGIPYFEGKKALYHVLPSNFCVDKLFIDYGKSYLPLTGNRIPFAEVYYLYSISHGQTPEQFYEKFFELKQQNDMKANEWLKQELNNKTKTLQSQTQEFVEVDNTVGVQVDDNIQSHGTR